MYINLCKIIDKIIIKFFLPNQRIGWITIVRFRNINKYYTAIYEDVGVNISILRRSLTVYGGKREDRTGSSILAILAYTPPAFYGHIQRFCISRPGVCMRVHYRVVKKKRGERVIERKRRSHRRSFFSCTTGIAARPFTFSTPIHIYTAIADLLESSIYRETVSSVVALVQSIPVCETYTLPSKRIVIIE